MSERGEVWLMLLIVLRKLLNKKEKVMLNVEEKMIIKIWIKIIENVWVLDFVYKSMRGEV